MMNCFRFLTRLRSIRFLVGFAFIILLCMQLITFVWLSSKGNSGYETKYCNCDAVRDTSSSIKKETEVILLITQNKTIKADKQEALTKARTTSTTSVTTSGNISKTSSPGTTSRANSVDMENDYYPLVNFSFVWPEIKPDLKGQRDLFLVVMVNSAAHGAKYKARRNAIRHTWANFNSCEEVKTLRNPKLSKLKWILVFSLGKSGETTEDQANAEEAKLNNDVLIGDFRDHYLNNVIKVFMGGLWVSTMNVRYILKTDDDVYVRVPLVIDWLVAQNYPTPFYGGAPYFKFGVDRDPKGKWAISRRYFAEEYFPTFCAGAFYVLSTDILTKLFNYVRRRKPFHTDDAYVGIAARDLNVSVLRIPGLLLEDNMPVYLNGFGDCRLLQAKGFGHSIEPPLMNKVFARLDDLCMKNRTC